MTTIFLSLSLSRLKKLRYRGLGDLLQHSRHPDEATATFAAEHRVPDRGERQRGDHETNLPADAHRNLDYDPGEYRHDDR